MTLEDVLNTNATFHNVRPGGPKDKRLRRVELMGENTPKPLHWMKVEQHTFDKLVSNEAVMNEMKTLADIGDIYCPIDCDTKEPLKFLLVGYFSKANLLPAFKRFNGISNGLCTNCG